jgi:hypothetical protein
MHYPRTVAAIAAASLLAAFAAQANKGAKYEAPKAEPEFPRFTLTGGVTYLQPSMDGLDYMDTTTGTPNAAEQYLSTETYNLDPGFDFGYFLGFGYMISDRYDVQATWTQLNSNDNESASLLIIDHLQVPQFLQSSSGTVAPVSELLQTDDLVIAGSEESLDYQMADATLGQYHKLTENLMTRVFAGIYYAKINSDVSNTYSVELGDFIPLLMAENPVLGTESYNSSFWGVGPELGLDLEYDIYKGFDVVGHFAAAFLIGELQTESQSYYNLPNSTQENVAGPAIFYISAESEEETQFVPALNAKLGLSYNKPYSNNKYRFGVEAGYQAAYYFNAVDQVQQTATNVVAGSQGKGLETTHHYTDVGIMGPYLNFSASF